MAGKRVLVVGGGKIASRKVERLLRARAWITLLSPELDDTLRSLWIRGCVCWVRGSFDAEVDVPADFVIAATSDPAVNAKVSDLFRARKVPVNVVDDREKSDFIFPAVVEFPEFTLSISTDGEGPGIAARLREFVEDHAREVEERVLRGARPVGKEKEGGRVVLVGAGPGAWDLLTLRALMEIKRADVVLRDYLVPDEVIAKSGTRAKVITLRRHKYGDRSGAAKRQNYANRLMARLASRGWYVVRLKCGDPFMFGRGGEELLYLIERGIPVEVVPGITAGIGAASSALLPLTLREVSSSVIFITGSVSGESALSGAEAIEGGGSCTVVVYMSSKNAKKVREVLLSRRVSLDLPAAIIERATWPDEKVYFTTVGEFPRVAEKVEGPALLVVGETVKLAKRFLEEKERLSTRGWVGKREKGGNECHEKESI